MTDQNPYDEVVTSLYSDPATEPPSPETQLRQSVMDGMQQNPDVAAKALPIAQANKIPLDMAVRNIAPLGTRENFDKIDFQQMLKDYPKLSVFMSNPENAAISHDDIPALQGVSSFFKGLNELDLKAGSVITHAARNIAGGLFTGFGHSALEGAGDTLYQTGEAIFNNANNDKKYDAVDRFLLKGIAGTFGAAGSITQFLGQGAEYWGEKLDTGEQGFLPSVERMIGMAGGSVVQAATAPETLVPTLMAQGAGSKFDEEKKDGTYGTAHGNLAAGLDAIIMGLFGKIGVTQLVEGLPSAWRAGVASTVAKMMARTGMNPSGALANIANRSIDIGYRAVSDAATGIAQTISQNAVDKNVLGKKLDLTEGAVDQGSIMGTVGLITGAIMNGLFHTNVHFGKEAAKYRAEQMAAGREAVAKSKTFARSPEKVNELIREETGNRDVYINPSVVDTFYQRMSPEEQAALNSRIPDFPDKLSESLKTGEDMMLSQADYHTYIQPIKGSEGLDHWVKFDPEQDSAAEQEKYQEFIDTLHGLAEKERQDQAGGKDIQDHIYQQLMQRYGQKQAPSGMPEAARLLSENPAKFHENMLSKYGHLKGAKEVLDRYVGNLKIVRDYPELSAAMRKSPEFDTFIDKLRNSEKGAVRAAQKKIDSGKGRNASTARPPIMSFISRHVDIHEGTPVGQEFANMGITRKSHPWLVKPEKANKGASMFGPGDAARGLDNIPASEFNDWGSQYGLHAPDDGNGYVDPDWLLEQISNEAAGHTAEDIDTSAERNAQADLLNILDKQGIDITRVSNDQVKEALQRFSNSHQNDGRIYAQPINPEVDPERLVKVVDLSHLSGKMILPSDLRRSLRALVGKEIPSADQKKIIKVLPKNVRHLMVSGAPIFKDALGPRKKSLLSISDLISSSVLVESGPNNKASKKPEVIAYHRFFVPVKIGETVRTVRIVAEQTKNSLTTKSVDLYDVVVESRKKNASPLSGEPALNGGRASNLNPVATAPEGSAPKRNTPEDALNPVKTGEGSTITIREMLSGVKDMKGKVYFQGDKPKGSVSFSPDRAAVMRLFEGENLSTVLHELGHVYWHAMKELASLPDAPADLLNDVDSVKRWLTEDTTYLHRHITTQNPYHVRDNGGEHAVYFKGAVVDRYLSEHEAKAQSASLYSDLLKHYEATGGEASLKSQTYGHMPETDLEEHIQTAMEEKIADGFLDYLRKGEAPSAEMKGAFQRFKAWISMIYKGIRDTLPKVNDEVKDVFDRMFATQEEIDAVKEKPEFSPDPVIRGMLNKADAEKYDKQYAKMVAETSDKLFRAAMRQSERKNTKEYKEARASLTKQMDAQASTEKRYQAIDVIVQNGGLNKKMLTGDFGKEILPYLIVHKGLVSEKGGMPPALAADLNGYKNSRDMIEDMMNAPKKKAYVERLADDEMVARHGDMLRDGTIEREAVNEFHNSLRAEMLAWELKKVSTLAKIPAPSSEAIKIKARNILGERVIREIIPHRFYRAEVRAARESGEALAKRNFEAAAIAKGKQLLNHHLYKMSLDARESMDKSVKFWTKLLRKKDKDLRHNMDIDFAYAARAVLGRHGFGPNKGNEDFVTWYTRLQQDNPDLASDIQMAMDNATMESPKAFKDMSWDEFQGLRDAVNSLIQVGKDTKNIMVEGRRVSKDAAVQELLDKQANQNPVDLTSPYAGKQTETDQWKKTVSGVKAMLVRPEMLFDRLDEGEFNGPHRRIMWNRISKATNEYRDARNVWMKKIYHIIEPEKDRLLGEKILAPELRSEHDGSVYTFENKGELIGMMAHLGNGFEPGSNGYKLLKGYGWDYDAFKQFMARMHTEQTIGKDDWDLVQKLWDLAEDIKPDVWRAHKEMKGFYPVEITHVPFKTPFGEYKGGYWPAIEDRQKSSTANVRAEKNALTQDNNYAFPTTGSGATKERSATYAGPLEMNLNLLPRHLDWALRFIHVEHAVKDVAKIIMDPKFRASMDSIDPAAVNGVLVPWLQRTAKQATELVKGESHYKVKQVANWLRRSSQMQTLALNLVYPAQRLGMIAPMVYRQGTHVAHAFVDLVGDIKGADKHIREASSFMRNRNTYSDDEYMQRVQRLMENRTKREKVRDWASDNGFVIQRLTHNFLDNLQWMAAYKQATSGEVNGIDATNEARAVEYADSEVRRTQGSFHHEDISASEGGSVFQKLFTVFYGPLNAQGNFLANEVSKIKRSNDGARAKSIKALSLYTMGYMIPALIADGLYAAFKGRLPEDKDHDGHLYDDWFNWFIGTQVKYGAGMVPIVRDIGMAVVNKLEGEYFNDSVVLSPVENLLNSLADTPFSVVEAVKDGKKINKAISDVLADIGALTQLPTGGTIKRSILYLSNVAQGKEHVDSVGGFVKGMLGGPGVSKK